jgi:hypothetical protein
MVEPWAEGGLKQGMTAHLLLDYGWDTGRFALVH